MKVCAIKECSSRVVKKGMCSTHWKRWNKGIYTIDKRIVVKGNIEEKIQKFTKRQKDGCLIWSGDCSCRGYGRTVFCGKRMPVHRAVYQYFNGPIKKDQDVHHKCGNKLCVEPLHLEVLSKFNHLKTLKRDSMGRLMPYDNS